MRSFWHTRLCCILGCRSRCLVLLHFEAETKIVAFSGEPFVLGPEKPDEPGKAADLRNERRSIR